MPNLELGGGVAVAGILASAPMLGAIKLVVRQLRARHTTTPRPAPVRPRLTVRRVALWQGTFALFLWILFELGFWTPASVGFSSRESPAFGFFAGVVLYGALTSAYSAALRVLNVHRQQGRAVLSNMARSLPKRGPARCAIVAMICIANPLTEELVYRGLLVHQFALLAGHAWAVIAVGALVNALNHAYQRFRAAPFHLLFFATAVGLLYSPFGMSALLGLHFVGDALPFLGFKDRLLEYRRSRKLARRLERS